MFVLVMQNQVQLEEEKWENLSLSRNGMQEFVLIQMFIINQQVLNQLVFTHFHDLGL